MTANVQNMYAIYDNKTEAFGAPFFSPTDGSAVRTIQDALASDTMLSRHPADYNLFCIGQWHSQTGEVRGVTPRNMGLLVDYVPKPTVPMTLPFVGEKQ